MKGDSWIMEEFSLVEFHLQVDFKGSDKTLETFSLMLRSQPQIIAAINGVLTPHNDHVAVKVNLESMTWCVLTKDEDSLFCLQHEYESDKFLRNLRKVVAQFQEDEQNIIVQNLAITKTSKIQINKSFEELKQESSTELEKLLELNQSNEVGLPIF